MSVIDIEQLTDRKAGMKFPNVLITTPNDTLPVVVRTLEEGDMQLVVEFNGKRKSVANMSQSAVNIDRLIRCVGKLSYHVSADESIEISDVSTYLECII